MKTKVVVADRRYSRWNRGQNHPGSWRVIWEYEGKEIPRDLPLTDAAVKHWQTHKDPLGCVNFRGHTLRDVLSIDDIKSIISAAKRGDANLYINRMGEVMGYKIKKEETK